MNSVGSLLVFSHRLCCNSWKWKTVGCGDGSGVEVLADKSKRSSDSPEHLPVNARGSVSSVLQSGEFSLSVSVQSRFDWAILPLSIRSGTSGGRQLSTTCMRFLRLPQTGAHTCMYACSHKCIYTCLNSHTHRPAQPRNLHMKEIERKT